MDTVVSEFLAQAREVITVKRVFGDAYEQDGATLIPVAAVRGGAGGGSGEGPGEQGGSGSGFGMTARPVGVYVIREGLVSWHPALDLNRVILGGQITAVALALVARAIVRAVRSSHEVASSVSGRDDPEPNDPDRADQRPSGRRRRILFNEWSLQVDQDGSRSNARPRVPPRVSAT